MYKEIKREGVLIGIEKLSNKAGIPIKEGNRDYQEYLEWLAAGNTPEPADS